MKTNIYSFCDTEKLLKGAIQNYFLKIVDKMDNGIPEKRKLIILSFPQNKFLQMNVEVDMAELEGFKLESFEKINFQKYVQKDGSTYAYFNPKNTNVLTYLKQAVIISLRYANNLETKKDMLEYLKKSNLLSLPKDSLYLIDNYYKNMQKCEKENFYNGKNML